MYRHLREKKHRIIDIHIAQVLNNLANLHSSCRSFDSAEKEYQEALEIMLRLSKGNQNFNMEIVDPLYNQAILHANTQRVKLVQQKLEKALNIIGSTDKPL